MRHDFITLSYIHICIQICHCVFIVTSGKENLMYMSKALQITFPLT